MVKNNDRGAVVCWILGLIQHYFVIKVYNGRSTSSTSSFDAATPARGVFKLAFRGYLPKVS